MSPFSKTPVNRRVIGCFKEGQRRIYHGAYVSPTATEVLKEIKLTPCSLAVYVCTPPTKPGFFRRDDKTSGSVFHVDHYPTVFNQGHHFPATVGMLWVVCHRATLAVLFAPRRTGKHTNPVSRAYSPNSKLFRLRDTRRQQPTTISKLTAAEHHRPGGILLAKVEFQIDGALLRKKSRYPLTITALSVMPITTAPPPVSSGYGTSRRWLSLTPQNLRFSVRCVSFLPPASALLLPLLLQFHHRAPSPIPIPTPRISPRKPVLPSPGLCSAIRSSGVLSPHSTHSLDSALLRE